MPHPPLDKHLDEAELNVGAHEVFKRLRDWVKTDASFEPHGEVNEILQDDRFSEASQPLFNEISKQMVV